jgi:hypothetical protein
MKLRVVEILSVLGHTVSISLVSYYGLKKLNSVALVHKGTVPTERPLLVGEVSANFYS